MVEVDSVCGVSGLTSVLKPRYCLCLLSGLKEDLMSDLLLVMAAKKVWVDSGCGVHGLFEEADGGSCLLSCLKEDLMSSMLLASMA